MILQTREDLVSSMETVQDVKVEQNLIDPSKINLSYNYTPVLPVNYVQLDFTLNMDVLELDWSNGL